MKKLIFAGVSASVLLIAGVAAAQTSTGVESSITTAVAGLSTLNGADASRPTGAAFDARSYVDQIGDHNTVTVNQQTAGSAGGGADDANFGSPLTSVVLQGWDNGRSTNSNASVTQSGLTNQSVVMQRNYPEGDTNGNNVATVNQSGKNDAAFTYQYGQNNTSSLVQTAQDSTPPAPSSVTDAASAGNGGTFASSFHGVDQTESHLSDAGGRIIQDEAIGDNASLNQAGVDNKASLVQWFAEGNTSNVIQNGTNNATVTYQTGATSLISVNQSAASNKASVFQVSADQDGAQYGAGSSTLQQASVSQTGVQATALVLQGGDSNQGSISQSNNDSSNTRSAVASDAILRQVGSGNIGGITQTGADDHAVTLQTGSGNNSSVYQQTEGAYSLVQQDGSGNIANVNQEKGLPSNSFFMVSNVNQSGLNNSAGVTQTGRDAFSAVGQVGTGTPNYAVINQAAFNAVSYAYQNGGGNSVNVYQH